MSWLLFAGLTGSSVTKNDREKQYGFYNNNVLNLELIPYHSRGITLPGKLNVAQSTYLRSRLIDNIDFIATRTGPNARASTIQW